MAKVLAHAPFHVLLAWYNCNPGLLERLSRKWTMLIWDSERTLSLMTREDVHFCMRHARLIKWHQSFKGCCVFVKRLAKMFIKLTSVDLSGGGREIGHAELLPFLQIHGETLKILKLNNCSGFTSMYALSEDLCSFAPNLRFLDVSMTPLTNTALETLLQGLFDLESLNVANCANLYPARLHLKHAKLKSLDCSNIYGFNPSLLAAFLHNLPSLTKLSLMDCDDLTQRDIETLNINYPKITIQHNAKLKDDTEASVRAYLLSLVVFDNYSNAIQTDHNPDARQDCIRV